ncbi:MAG TPA: caspase family protein, partial [Polyangiaceae bacterium]|nr:caspase family protein [Polyangiaceae bacterium]
DKGVIIKRANGLELVRDGRFDKVVEGAGQIAAARDKIWSAVSAEKDYSQGLPDEDAGHTLRALTPAGKQTLSVALEREPFRIAAAADGSVLVVTYFDAIRGTALQLIDGKTGSTLHTIEGRPSGVDSLAMSRDGASLAVGSLAAVSFWRMPSAELWFSTPERRLRGAQSLSYDRAGVQLASIEAGWIRVRSAKSGRLLRAWKHHLGQPSMLAFRGDNELVTGDDLDGSLYRWDLREIPKESRLDPDNLIQPLAPPRGSLIAKLDFEIVEGALDPSGKHAIVAGREGRLALVDLLSGTILWRIESKTSFGYALAFSADGKRVLLSGHREQPPTASHMGVPILRAFDVSDGKQLVEVETPTAGAIAARAEAIAVAGEHPALFEPYTLKLRARLDLPDTRFTAVIADPRRPSFLFGGAAGSTAIVDSRGGLHAVLVVAPGGDWIATTPDGLYRASIDGARRIAWSYKNPLEAFSFEQFADRFERPDLLEKSILSLGEPSKQMPRARPPRIHALSVDGNAGGRATVSARVTDRRQVSHVRAYVNGRLAATQQVCAPQADVHLEVPLDPGANRVALIAHGPDGLASHARSVDLRSPARAARPTLWVVAIGVSRYDNLAEQYQLEYADDDARSIAKTLTALAGPGRPFARARVRTLVDRQVSAAALEESLASLANMAPSDVAVVFLAGHGIRLRDGKMRFLTHDATLRGEGGVGWSALEGALERARGRVILLLDACHSGHVITDPVAPNESLAKALAARHRAGALVFAAARGSELSYEVGNETGARALELALDGEPAPTKLARGHGLFTSALLEAFSGRAVDRDKSGALELDEIIGHVSERVRAASAGRQNPWVARRELFGDFALVPMH